MANDMRVYADMAKFFIGTKAEAYVKEVFDDIVNISILEALRLLMGPVGSGAGLPVYSGTMKRMFLTEVEHFNRVTAGKANPVEIDMSSPYSAKTFRGAGNNAEKWQEYNNVSDQVFISIVRGKHGWPLRVEIYYPDNYLKENEEGTGTFKGVQRATPYRSIASFSEVVRNTFNALKKPQGYDKLRLIVSDNVPF